MSTPVITQYSGPTVFVRAIGTTLSLGVSAQCIGRGLNTPQQQLSGVLHIMNTAKCLGSMHVDLGQRMQLNRVALSLRDASMLDLVSGLAIGSLNLVRNARLVASSRPLTRLSRADRSAAMVGDALSVAELGREIYRRRIHWLPPLKERATFARMVLPIELERLRRRMAPPRQLA